MADKTARIEFEEYPGKTFIVRLSPVPLDPFVAVNDALTTISSMSDLRGVVDQFAELGFIGWEGIDDEPTPENLRKQDVNLLLALIGQWTKAVAEAPVPLPRTSGAGEPSKARRASSSRRS